ncbi:MAG: DsbA family protein [Candidatus Binatia bacterium]
MRRATPAPASPARRSSSPIARNERSGRVTLHLIAYSDYLCPWCFNAAVRLRRVEAEFAGAVTVEWRSFLLRPQPDPRRTLEKFRAYTQSWLRAAADPDGGEFSVWRTDAGPPSHSVPPHLVAKAAAALGPQAFERMHAALLRAYFTDNRDITDATTLRAIWSECDLPADALATAEAPETLRAVIEQHNEALELGITGVPAVHVAGDDAFVVGAQPLETYRRWVQRLLGRGAKDKS